MHYYPAALIGQFRTSDSRGEGRDAAVWVARRGVDRAVRTAASKCGVDRDAPQLYAKESGDARLDDLWRRSEDMWAQLKFGLEAVRQTGTAPAHFFVNVLVPFAAQLLARPPRLMLDELSDLTDGLNRDALVDERSGVFAQFADALLYSRRWLLVEVPDGALVSSDLGWHWMPGAMPGEVFMPVSPTTALVIRGGQEDPTYHLDDEWVDIPVVQWEPEWTDLRVEAMMLAAPREVFCSRREQAERAIKLWGENDTPGEPVNEMAQNLAGYESWLLAGLLLEGASAHPAVAWSRFMLATHRFGPCRCREDMMRQGLTEAEAEQEVRVMERLMAAAEKHLKDT